MQHKNRVRKCDVTNFITTAEKYSWKYELWWKFDVNWAKDGWDMTRWVYKYCHTFSLICSVRTESKITENVWRFLFVPLVVSQRIFARFCPIFNIMCIFESSFWILTNIMTRLKKCEKKKNVLWRHYFGTLYKTVQFYMNSRFLLFCTSLYLLFYPFTALSGIHLIIFK